jgi:hypothetical protein
VNERISLSFANFVRLAARSRIEQLVRTAWLGSPFSCPVHLEDRAVSLRCYSMICANGSSRQGAKNAKREEAVIGAEGSGRTAKTLNSDPGREGHLSRRRRQREEKRGLPSHLPSLNHVRVPSRMASSRRGSQEVQDTGLLNRRGVHAPPRVRIPPSPPLRTLRVRWSLPPANVQWVT